MVARGTRHAKRGDMRSYLVLLCSPLVVAALVWTLFAACIDAPPESRRSLARLVVAWDPLACGDPHRLVVELRDDAGAVVSASTPCSLGTLAVDVAQFGSYRARLYAWALGLPPRPSAPTETTDKVAIEMAIEMAIEVTIELTIDQPIVHWDVMVPP
jgi:hypothetical protein